MKGSHDTVKWRLCKIADLTLPDDYHAKNTGHDAADRDRRIARCSRRIIQKFSVLYRHGSGKIDSHRIILDRPHHTRLCEIVILRHIFCLTDAAQNLLLSLRIDPDAELLHALTHAAELPDIFLDRLSFFSGISCPVDRVNILAVQHFMYHIILPAHRWDHIIFVIPRQKRQILQPPFFIPLIILLRVHHLHQMPHAPGDDIPVVLYITVISSGYAENPRELLRNTRFLRDDQRFCHNLFLQLLSHEANYSIFLDIGQLTVHSYPPARTAYPAPPWR